MRQKPWFKMDARDWLSDFMIASCSLEARGLLIDMMCIAHDGDPYGYVMASGRALSVDDLARYRHVPKDKIKTLLDELLDNSRIHWDHDATCFYIRRMVQDEKHRQEGVINGRKGGNPNLIKGAKKTTAKPKVPKGAKHAKQYRECLEAANFDFTYEEYATVHRNLGLDIDKVHPFLKVAVASTSEARRRMGSFSALKYILEDLAPKMHSRGGGHVHVPMAPEMKQGDVDPLDSASS